jgi:hypothetical protein
MHLAVLPHWENEPQAERCYDLKRAEPASLRIAYVSRLSGVWIETISLESVSDFMNTSI